MGAASRAQRARSPRRALAHRFEPGRGGAEAGWDRLGATSSWSSEKNRAAPSPSARGGTREAGCPTRLADLEALLAFPGGEIFAFDRECPLLPRETTNRARRNRARRSGSKRHLGGRILGIGVQKSTFASLRSPSSRASRASVPRTSGPRAHCRTESSRSLTSTATRGRWRRHASRRRFPHSSCLEVTLGRRRDATSSPASACTSSKEGAPRTRAADRLQRTGCRARRRTALGELLARLRHVPFHDQSEHRPLCVPRRHVRAHVGDVEGPERPSARSKGTTRPVWSSVRARRVRQGPTQAQRPTPRPKAS